jgi:hypothetical protein
MAKVPTASGRTRDPLISSASSPASLHSRPASGPRCADSTSRARSARDPSLPAIRISPPRASLSSSATSSCLALTSFVGKLSPRRSDSCRTPFPSIRSTHFEPLQVNQSGAGSTVPVATRSSRLPSSSESSSYAVTSIPARKATGRPSGSRHVSSCDRHKMSPNNPLKSARTRLGMGISNYPMPQPIGCSACSSRC